MAVSACVAVAPPAVSSSCVAAGEAPSPHKPHCSHSTPGAFRRIARHRAAQAFRVFKDERGRVLSKSRMLVLQVSCESVISENMRKKPEKMGCNISTMTNLHEQVSVSHIVREGSLGDFWQIADTHCGAFLPETKFPMDYIFRCDRMMALLASFSLHPGQKRKYLVAVENEASVPTNSFHADFTNIFSFGFGVEEKVQDNHISGILTVDTLAEFLPRQKRTGRRRVGIAYISNVAVKTNYRRKGIAKKLVQEAEMVARGWGCRSIALHCEISNAGAVALYKGEGYKAVKVPAGAKWPKPKGLPDSNLLLMMKVLFVHER